LLDNGVGVSGMQPVRVCPCVLVAWVKGSVKGKCIARHRRFYQTTIHKSTLKV
jgi:hypothetical protein